MAPVTSTWPWRSVKILLIILPGTAKSVKFQQNPSPLSLSLYLSLLSLSLSLSVATLIASRSFQPSGRSLGFKSFQFCSTHVGSEIYLLVLSRKWGNEMIGSFRSFTHSLYMMISIHYRRKFRSQTSDNMDRWKAMGRVREEKRRRERKSQKKEDPGARKGRKVAKHCVFPIIWSSGESKSRLAKTAGAEPAGQVRDKKLHAVVARNAFPSQNVQSTSAPEHF